MLKTLKIIETPANSKISLQICTLLSDIVEDLKFIRRNIPDIEDFRQYSETLLKANDDFFCWDANDMPEFLVKGLDYFFVTELETAIVFKNGSQFFYHLRNYFCPPIAFIGAGPGNPEWLTLEAKYLLDRCDIVFYDALVNPLIIASLPENTEKFFVGKRGDSESFDQQELNTLIIDHARRGYKVGRLKGGDPGILGRITEEIDAILQYQLSFQVLPGITAMQSIISCAGIHLTQRGICDRVTITTARSAGGEVNNLLPFNEASLIVYMGILSAENIQTQLLEAGYSKNLPTAILQNLTRSNQKIIHTTLENLSSSVKENNIRPPGLLLFGKTARKDLQRISPAASLNGRKVLILNTEPDAIQLSLKIRRWGGTPLFLYRTLLSIDHETIIPDYDDVIFFTPKEVSDFYELLGGAKISPLTNAVSIGEDVDATFYCLFRKKSLLTNNFKEAVRSIKKQVLNLSLE